MRPRRRLRRRPRGAGGTTTRGRPDGGSRVSVRTGVRAAGRRRSTGLPHAARAAAGTARSCGPSLVNQRSARLAGRAPPGGECNAPHPAHGTGGARGSRSRSGVGGARYDVPASGRSSVPLSMTTCRSHNRAPTCGARAHAPPTADGMAVGVHARIAGRALNARLGCRGSRKGRANIGGAGRRWVGLVSIGVEVPETRKSRLRGSAAATAVATGDPVMPARTRGATTGRVDRELRDATPRPASVRAPGGVVKPRRGRRADPLRSAAAGACAPTSSCAPGSSPARTAAAR
jgi:hypothetical protein